MYVLSLFVVVQFKYNVKRLELFKIRRYIKCPLLLLLFYVPSDEGIKQKSQLRDFYLYATLLNNKFPQYI